MWGGRAQYSDNSSIERGFIAIPITVSYLGVRAGPHVLELGGGITIDNGGGGPRLLTVYASAEPFRVDRVRGEPMVCFISARGGRATEDHEGQGRRYTGSKALG
jgi:hypothetical protein